MHDGPMTAQVDGIFYLRQGEEYITWRSGEKSETVSYDTLIHRMHETNDSIWWGGKLFIKPESFQ